MANPERPNSNHEDFDSFSNQFDSSQPIGEEHETVNPERVKKLGHTALERYNLLTPKLEEQQDAQRRISEGLANTYYEMREGDSSRAERIAVLEREIESIGLEIESLQQQLDLARAALDELEGRSPNAANQSGENVDQPSGSVDQSGENLNQPGGEQGEGEQSGENEPESDHFMYNIETTDGPITVVDGEVVDGRSEDAKRRNPLPDNFAEQVENGLLDGNNDGTSVVENVESTDEVGYTVKHNLDGTDTFEFSDGTSVIMPNADDIANMTDGTNRPNNGSARPGEDWAQPVSPEEAAEIEREAAEAQVSEKMKKPSRFKRWAVTIGLGAALLGSILGGPLGQSLQANHGDDPQNTPIEQVAEAAPVSQTESYENMNQTFDYDSSYSLPGLYSSVNKPNAAAFACGDEVNVICEGDDIRAAEYVTQVRETMANYVAGHIPDQLKHPDDIGIDSQVELSERYDGLSNEEYDAVYQHYCDVFENHVRVSRSTISGTYDNAYEYTIDHNGSLGHENVELGRSTTEENNTEVIVYTFLDDNGNVIGELTVKNSCRQAVDKQGSNEKSYQGMQERNPDEPQHYDSGNETQGNENQTQGNENHTQGDENPSQGDENPSQGNENPSQGNENPSQGDENPSQGNENPSQGDENPSQGNENPTQGDENPSQFNENPPSLGDENQEQIKPKDPENLERIDDQILDDIADDIGTGEVTVTPTPSEVVDAQKPTEKPSGEDFEGTGPTIVDNSASQEAEPVQPSNPENDYSQDLGGAHDTEYAPVVDNTPAQEEADRNEIPPSEAPSTAEEAKDTLADLGIN